MTDFFYSLPKSRQHIFSLAILFIVPFILFFDITLGGMELERHDIIQWRAGAESVIEYREMYGEEPLWASNMFGGMPAFVVSTQLQVPHLDFFSRYFQKIYPAFPFWVMLSGMYVLLISIGFRPLTAVFGSFLYGLTTYFPVIIMAGHTSKFVALGYAPWIISGYWLLTRSEKRILGLLLFTASMALEVRAGHPQITYYFMYLLGGLWIYDSYRFLQSQNIKKWGLITIMLITGGVVGILGSSEKILSQQSYAPYSIRGGTDLEGTTGLDRNYAFAWSQGVSETLTLALPDLFGGASPAYWGPKSFTSGPHYLGALALLFIIFALFKVRKKELYIFLGIGFLAILFSWGASFALLNNFAFKFIPFFDKFRAPETWLVVTAFSFTVVAAYGLDKLFDLVEEKNFAIKQLYPALGTTFGVFLLLFVMVRGMDFVKFGEVQAFAQQIAQQNQVRPDNPQVLQRAESYVNTQLVPMREKKANREVMRLGIFLGITGGLIYAVSTKKISPTIAGLSFILLVGVDMMTVAHRYIDDTKFVEKNTDAERLVLSQQRDVDLYISENITKGGTYPYRVFPLDIPSGPFSNAMPSYFYPSLGGYSGAKLSLAQDVFMATNSPLFGGSAGINLGLLEVLNTRYLTYNPGINISGLTPVFTGASSVVYELDNVLPKAFFVDSAITVDSPTEAYELIFPDKVDFATTAVVENFTPTIEPDSTATVEVTNYQNGAEITLDITRNTPGFLVLSEIYYPNGWVALLNGVEIPIYKTNYLLRGLQIPPGEHTLELDFRPSSFYTGVKLSWLALTFQLLLLGIFGYSALRNRADK